MTEAAEVAARLAAATLNRDLEMMDALLAPCATIWHNTDGVRQEREQALAAIGEFQAAVVECRYAQVRINPFPGGFVQQHILEARFAADGPLYRVPCCIVVNVEGGLITRIDEYLDPSSFSAPDM